MSEIRPELIEALDKEVKVTMNTNTVIHKILAVLLIVCLVMPGVALAGGKSGKKNYREGVKYEELQQWDMAAQQFALAVAAEPNNAEYRLHYLRALQQASMMFVKRGDALAEQNDHASAYTAYRQAYNFDQGNEVARLKMERMLELQKSQASGSEQVNANKIGNVMPTSNEIQVAAKPRSRDVVQSINFKEAKFKTVVLNLGKQLGLNVVFDESVKDVPVSIDLTDVTVAKALDIIFKTYKYSFEQVDRRTVLIYQDNPTNRPRFESLMVKTFYLGNITAAQARTALQAMLPPGRQMASLDQGNAQGSSLLVVKATPTELQLVQDILDSLDKNKNEVVLDVEIYEVSHDSILEIGNQLVTKPLDVVETRFDSSGKPFSLTTGSTASLNNLGGVGRAAASTIAGNVYSPFLGGIGTLIGLPPTQLSLLQSKGNSKLLYRTQIHVLDGQKNTTKVGRSVPVRLGFNYPYGGGGGGVIGGAIGQTGGNVPGGINSGVGGLGGFGGGYGGFGGIDSIQYRDVGLVIDAEPTITNEGYVEIKMKFETSDVLASGADATNLTPIFTQRSLTTTARIQDSVTAVVAGVNQDSKGDSRASIPILGMVPILGRFFTTPRQENRQSDVIITVTPHIVRSQGINKDDHLAKYAGQQQAGPAPSVEEVVYRAQQEEEQERRLIAQQIPQSVPLNAQTQVNAVSTDFNNLPRTPNQPTVQPVANTRQPKVINNQTVGRTAGNVNSAPPSGSPASYPTSPEPQPLQPQPQPQIENVSQPGVSRENPVGTNPQSPPGEGQPPAGNDKTQANAGENPDISGAVEQPSEPVPPATLMMAKRPEHIEKALAKMKADKEAAEKAAKDAKSKPQANRAEAPQEFVKIVNQQARTPEPPLQMAQPSRGGAIALSLSPSPARPQVGKTLTVAVDINGQAQMTGVNLELKFDPAKLRVKSVRDGGMLGVQPDLTYEVEKGVLIVRLKQTQPTPTLAEGRLVLVEFIALADGQTEISFNSSTTRVRTPGDQNATAVVSSAQIIISRDTVKNAQNEK